MENQHVGGNVVFELARSIPPITRSLLLMSACLMTLTSLDIITPHSLYFNSEAIFRKREWWRLFTSVVFFGELGIHFLWTSYILVLYCGKLESDCYESKKLRFVWRLGFILLGIWISGFLFPYTLFLSNSFMSTLMYIWSRKNPDVMFNVIVFNIQAPYLAWFMLAFHYAMGHNVFEHLVGIILGHLVYFLDDVYPQMAASHGKKPLDPPYIIERILTIH